MKKLSFMVTLLLLMTGVNSYAQIQIVRNDFGAINDVIYYKNDTTIPLTFTPGNSGQNITWNLGMLRADYMDSIRFIDPQTIPDAPEDANLGIEQPETENTYFIISNNGVKLIPPIVGFGGGNTELQIIKFPFFYGTPTLKDSTTSVFKTTPTALGINVPLIDSVRINIKIKTTSTVDGEGTLITQDDSYPALRVHNISSVTVVVEGKNIITRTWSVIPANLLPFDIPNENIQTYSWYGKNKGYHLAEVELDTAGKIIGVNWQTSKPTATSISTVFDNPNTIKVYPNPAANTIYFSVSTKYTITNLSGKLILAGTAEMQESVDISGLNNGIYFIECSDATTGMGRQLKLVIAH
jgi:hypothetical protein